MGDPVNGVQPVEYLEEHVIESDTFTYSVPAEDRAAGKIANDYWADIAQQTRYKRFVIVAHVTFQTVTSIEEAEFIPYTGVVLLHGSE